MKPQFELLLPVGNSEMALAAIHNGADAIYLGFPGFNARGRTVDFELDQLKTTIENCHLYGVKVNLALNILIFQNELEKVTELLSQVIPLKPDAFIVQDLGLVRLIREMAPEQVIHASTQMTITNHEAISLLDDLNIKRFVLGRENSLAEIKLIKEKTDKDLEVFVHGALCVSYSGQCFTSESLGGRSANRGQCAQSCRYTYEMFVDGEPHKTAVDRNYLVSPQDLCGIREIPELMDIGVSSFKIEGRLKTPEYVAEAAREYRRVIDAHAKGKALSSKDLQIGIKKMATTYSRGFFSGWLHGVNHQKLVEGTFSAHRGFLLGKVYEVRADALLVQLESDSELKAGDGLLWVYKKSGETIEDGGQIYQSRRLNGRTWELKFGKDKKLSSHAVGAKLYINSDSELSRDIAKSYTDKNLKKRIPVTYHVVLEKGQPLKASLTDGQIVCQAETSSPLESAQKQGVTNEFIAEELAALGGTVFDADDIQFERKSTEALFCSHKELKELRRSLTDQLAQKRSEKTVGGFAAKTKSLSEIKTWMDLQKQESSTSQPCLNVLLRERGQVDDVVKAISAGTLQRERLGAVILDFEFGRDFAPSLEKLKLAGVRCGIATTRILKPQEYLNLKVIERLQPDVILVRNLGALRYYTEVSPFAGDLLGDFSLNVTNHLTVQYLLSKGLKSLCLSYDLNRSQVNDLLMVAPAAQLEITVHQYMPSFHMEHCVFAAFLSKGTSFRDCGKPCEKHQVELRDQFGNNHQIKPDQECRNTMYNAVSSSAARFVPEWRKRGLGQVRFEALRERGADLITRLQGYLDLLSGERQPEELVSSLHLMENYGLGEGTFAQEKKYQDRKKDSHPRHQ